MGEEGYYKGPKDERLGGKKTLELDAQDEIPVPKSYKATERHPNNVVVEIAIEFVLVRINADNPVVFDNEARDLLKAAWDNRYVLPKEIRIMGSFRRRLLGGAPRWFEDDVQGDFQVWGMGDIQAKLDERFQRDARPSQVKDLTDKAHDRIRWIFGFLQPTPFEEEFKGCGFRLEEAKKGVRIDVLGYEKALAFLVDGDRYLGHLQYGTDDKAWWMYKIKETRDGNFVLALTRKISDEKYTLKLSYAKVKNFQLPKKFNYLRLDGNRGRPFLEEWSFKKLRVEMPKK